MPLNSEHKYIAVLGSCCTADATGSSGFEAIASARLRSIAFQGRTSFLSMTSGPLLPAEFEYTREGQNAPKLEWEFRMVKDEIGKHHQERLQQAISLIDGLVVDHISAYMFPVLIDPEEQRYFLESWEWKRYIQPRIELKEARLWELPLELSCAALRQVFASLYDRQPKLSVIFHLPPPAFNDGVDFNDPEVTANISFYHKYCDRVFEEAVRHFPRIYAVSLPSPRADVVHAKGLHPFRFEKTYLKSVREAIERTLGV